MKAIIWNKTKLENEGKDDIEDINVDTNNLGLKSYYVKFDLSTNDQIALAIEMESSHSVEIVKQTTQFAI